MFVYELLESKIINSEIESFLIMYEKSSKRDVQMDGYFAKEGKAEIEEYYKVIKGDEENGSFQVISKFKMSDNYESFDDAILSINNNLKSIK